MQKLKVLIFLLLPTMVAVGQDPSDVFKETTPITWLGLDFTATKFIGDRERLGSESDLRHLLVALNELLITEEAKFDIAAAIDKKKVVRDFDVTQDNNAKLDVMGMLSNSEKDYLHLTREGVAEIISKYDFKGLTGIGLMFNIESFSKLNAEASMYVTFIAMDTKEVLFTERLVAPPAGFGMRNFWAKTVYEVMIKMKKKEFAMWKRKYFRP